MDNQEIIFRSSALKLRLGFDDKATLSWNVQSAKSVVLDVPKIGVLSLSNHGEYIVQPKSTTIYKLVARFADGTEQTKHLKIEVLPESQASFDVIEIKDENGIHAELRWSVSNASEITLNGEKVNDSGFKKYLITEVTSLEIKYVDAFGTKSKSFTIEPVNSIKFWVLRFFYGALKLAVRPFTFIGNSSAKEYKWSAWILFLCLLAVIAKAIIPNQHQLENFSICFSRSFSIYYKWISVILFLWLMAFAKRRKDEGDSPWVIIWFLPLFVIYFTPYLYRIIGMNIIIGCVFYGIYFAFFILCAIGVSSSSKSKFNFKKEFTPDFLLNKTKTGYELKSFIIR
jgi:hypothetical protein